MEKILQITSFEKDELITRFDGLETAIKQIAEHLNGRADHPEYLTRKEAAAMLQISLVTLSEWVNKGVLRAYKIGRRVYLKTDEISAAMVQKGGVK